MTNFLLLLLGARHVVDYWKVGAILINWYLNIMANLGISLLLEMNYGPISINLALSTMHLMIYLEANILISYVGK